MDAGSLCSGDIVPLRVEEGRQNLGASDEESDNFASNTN